MLKNVTIVTEKAQKCTGGKEWKAACFKKCKNNCLNTNIYSYLETSGGQS
jgi:hypothetical protein